MQLIPVILRSIQVIFAVIVLGLSVDLARGQDTSLSKVPPATGYAAFCGGFGVLAALIGVAALFASSLNGIITWALDGLSGLTMLASGITYAVLLRGTNCANEYTTWDNTITSGGCATAGKYKICRYAGDELKSRCTSAKADDAFMFISFVTCIGIVAYSFFARGSSVSYA